MTLGIDIGGTHIKVGFVENEKVTTKDKLPTAKNLEEFCQQIKK